MKIESKYVITVTNFKTEIWIDVSHSGVIQTPYPRH